ncbi:MAG: S-methyl-5'-thioadenosine phosphorylase [Phycisphaeraceae bacterium]
MSDTPLRIGIIGGSGLDFALAGEKGDTRDVDTPFGKPSSPVTLTTWEGVEVAIILRHGPGHLLSPTDVPYRANIYALKSLGVTHILASGACGSLREGVAPGELVVVDQVIDKTSRRANTFYEKAAVHVEMAEPFCPVMRKWLLDAAGRLAGVRVHDEGTYVCMEGPAFSTRAESHMHRQWGGDLIGMTCMPEAKLAREAEIAYALVAMPTDYDCWRPHEPGKTPQALLEEILGNLKTATKANLELMKAALADLTLLREQRSPAHDALKLAIFSGREQIDPGEVERLSVLWGRYFEARA